MNVFPGGIVMTNDPAINPGMEEVCGNGIDDNCDGNVDENCCPFWTVEEIVALAPTLYFDWRLMNCFTAREVGFVGPTCNFGLDYDFVFVIDINCNEFSNVDLALLQVCDEVLVQAQAILNAPSYCGPTSVEKVSSSLAVNPLDSK